MSNYTKHTNAVYDVVNPYVDKYTGFTWNNIHSSNFNCFIENTGHLEFIGAPDFSNNFVSPTFQTRTYYTGMQTGSKKFTLNLVFYQLTLSDLNAALHWLDRNIISDFYFDYEPYWKYSCKLSSIGSIEKRVVGRCNIATGGQKVRLRDLYLCRVPVTFETVYKTEANSTYSVYFNSNEGVIENTNFTDDYQNHLTDYFDTNSNFKFVEQVNEATDPYWDIKLYNPSAYPTYFKLHLYNIVDTLTIYEVFNKQGDDLEAGDIQSLESQGQFELDSNYIDIDCAYNITPICHIELGLDNQFPLDLHYNSEDGTVISCNRLIEQLRTTNSKIPCKYKTSIANIMIPGAVDVNTPAALYLRIVPSDKNTASFAIEYNIYEYMV